MAEDLLDYWVRLIRTIFPANARINSRVSNNDHLIEIDWKLQNDSEYPAKSSKKIEMVIKESTIDNYLDKTKLDRELSDILLKNFIRERYNHFIYDYDIHSKQYASKVKWLISMDVLNCNP